MPCLWRGSAFLVLLAVVLCLMPLAAQVSTADILGTITDSSGAVLVDAKITVENPETNLVRAPPPPTVPETMSFPCCRRAATTLKWNIRVFEPRT